MLRAQQKDTTHSNGNGSRVQEMIQCRQKQWNSGLCKDRYCEDCKRKKEILPMAGVFISYFV